MNKNDFQKLGQDWKILNEEYDNLIEQYLHNPDQNPDRETINKMKEMQKELYNIETRLFEIIEGQVSIVE